MSLTPDDVRKIAHLARLDLHESQIPALTQDLTNILDLVNEMNRVSTDQVPPLAHPHEATQFLREDVVTETNQRDLFLKNAPQTMGGLFIVPKVIETE